MHAICHYPVHAAATSSDHGTDSSPPYFQARDHRGFLELEILLPGVSPESVQVAVEVRDLVVIARQPRPVRPNWQAAHFEAVQRDYELRFFLGSEFDSPRIRTRMQDGILKVWLPKMRRPWPAARSAKAR